MQPTKFDPTGVQTHDSTFHVTETTALTTRPSVTSFHVPETPPLTTQPSVTIYVNIHSLNNRVMICLHAFIILVLIPVIKLKSNTM